MDGKDPIVNDQFLQTIGLVVCGGRSSRMGRDKSLLVYGQRPQRYEVYGMLQNFCDHVYISCNEEQVNGIEDGYSFLADQDLYKDIGPMAALLTASGIFPEKNILFIGCDYPFLTRKDLKRFAACFNQADRPAAFYNQEAGCYEPLLAWYPSHSYGELRKMYEAKQYSLQHFLSMNAALRFLPENKESMKSVDTKEDLIKALEVL